jgi:serine/threonine protein kinase
MSTLKLKLSRCPPRQQNVSLPTDDIFDIFEHLTVPITQLYTLGAVLGRGSAASVRLGIERATGKEVAVKIVNTTTLSTRAREDLNREVRILSSVTHANVVHLIRAYRDHNAAYLVQELVSGGELFDFILRHGHVREHRAMSIARHLASAVAYLHCKGIVHRDIKPENVLMSHTSDVVKLADFGLAVVIHTSSPANLKRFCGTPMYVAPEIVERATHGFKADVWSLGILLYVTLSGETPFPDEDDVDDLWDRIKRGAWSFDESPEIWNQVSVEARDLITKMLVVDPAERLSAQEVCNHRWFSMSPGLTAEASVTSVASAASAAAAAAAAAAASVAAAAAEATTATATALSSSVSSSVKLIRPPIKRQRSQSFAAFRREATRSVSKMQMLPESSSRSSSPVPTDSSVTSTSSSTSSTTPSSTPISASFSPAPTPSSAVRVSISPRSSARKQLCQTLPTQLCKQAFTTFVNKYGLDDTKAIDRAFNLLDYDKDDAINVTEIERALHLAQVVARTSMSEWLTDKIIHTTRDANSSNSHESVDVVKIAVQSVMEHKIPASVRDRFMKVYERHVPKTATKMRVLNNDIVPSWLLNAVAEASWDPDVSCHFLFNPKLNTSWLSDTSTSTDGAMLPFVPHQIGGSSSSFAAATAAAAAAATAAAVATTAAVSFTFPSLHSTVPSVSSPPLNHHPLQYSPTIRPSLRVWKRELLHQMSNKIHATATVLSKHDVVKESLEIVCAITSSERATVYLISDDGREVVSFVNKDPRQNLAIRVKMGQGIAGTVAESGRSIIVNDPYNDDRFDRSTDERTGYTTKNMMTVPIVTWDVREETGRVVREKCIIGAVQVLNKSFQNLNMLEKQKNGEETPIGYTANDLRWLDEWNNLIGIALNQAHNHAKFVRKILGGKKQAHNHSSDEKPSSMKRIRVE